MTYEQVKRASEAAYKAYSQHVPHGEGGNETAVKAGREAWATAVAVYDLPDAVAGPATSDLTETLKRMRALAAHNYGGKQ